jgi:hypothetical protein
MNGGAIWVASAPIELRANKVQEFQIVLEKKQLYGFHLRFIYKDDADHKRIIALMGRMRTDRSGRDFREGGVGTPVRLIVKKLEGSAEQEVFSSGTDPLPTGVIDSAFGRLIGHKLLTPGRYVVSLVPLTTPQEFSATPVDLRIFYDSNFTAK